MRRYRLTRKRIVLIVLTAVGLPAAWTAAWLYVQREIERQTVAWVEQQRARGTAIDYAALAVTGWPLWWRIAIEAPHVVLPAGRGEWRGTRAEAWLRPWAYLNIPLRFAGDHVVRVPNGATPIAVTLSAAQPDARVQIARDGRPEEAELDARDATVQVEGAGPAGPYRAAQARLLLRLHRPPASHRDPLLDLALSLIDVDLPQPPVPGLATRVQRADLDASLRGDVPFAPGGTLGRAVAAWRDAGGTLEVTRLVLVAAPIDFDGNATAALDAQNRVQLSFVGRLRGYAETIDALQRARTLQATQAFAVRTAFTLLQQQGPDGRLQVQIQGETFEGLLRINGIAVARMLPLRIE